jgi:hypothetical protein
MHAQLVTRVIHAMLAQRPVATSAVTGAQHLLHVAASFRPTTAHLALSTVIHAHRAIHATAEHLVVSKIDLHAPSTATHARHAHSIVTRVRLVTTVHHALSIAMHAQRALSIVTHARLAMGQHLVASKTVRPELLTATHVRRETTVHHALSIVTHAQHATHATVERHVVGRIAQRALSIATHVQLVMAMHARHALSTAQNRADLASSMTDLASSTATTAMTAPTVVQTALTA